MLRALGLCILRYHTRDRRYDLLRPLGPASCDITHETRGTNCFGHWVLRLEISHTGQGVPFVTGIGPLHLNISLTRHGVRFVTGIGLCILRYHTRNRGYDLLRASGSASSDITHETRGTIRYGHWVLCFTISHTKQEVRFATCIGPLYLAISHTRQGVRFVTGSGFCIL